MKQNHKQVSTKNHFKVKKQCFNFARNDLCEIAQLAVGAGFSDNYLRIRQVGPKRGRH